MVFFTQLWDSFNNFKAYTEFAYQKNSKTITYFFILFSFIFIVSGIRSYYDFSQGFSETVNTFKDKIPEFTFSKGELKVEGTQPLIFEGENHTLLAIDTTGKIDETILNQYSEGVFIGKNKLVSKQDMELRTVMFDKFKGFQFDKRKLLKIIPSFKWIFVLFGVFAYFFSVVWVLITTVFLALVGNLMAKRPIKEKLRFTNYWNVAVYALSLPWLLEMFKNLIYPVMPLFTAVKWVIAAFIMYKALDYLNTNIQFGDGEYPV